MQLMVEETKQLFGIMLTCNQEGGAVGAKLIPEGGEEVQKLENLDPGCTACEGAP